MAARSSRPPAQRRVAAVALIACLAAFGGAARTAYADEQDVAGKAARAMERGAGVPLKLVRSPNSGTLAFVSVPNGYAVPIKRRADEPIGRALEFLSTYAAAFQLDEASSMRIRENPEADALGMQHVRLQQMHGDIPVSGGEVIVHLRDAGVVSASAKTLRLPPSLADAPRIDASQAATAVQTWLAKHRPEEAEISVPRLEVFNRGLLEGTRRATRLAWAIEARAPGLREQFWIDAQRGSILLHFSRLVDARQRAVYVFDPEHPFAGPGTLTRSEGDPATGDADVDAAYDFSGDAYDYFLTVHGRDSYDGSGAPIVSIVHFCPPDFCPFENAVWNGVELIFGAGFALADDVVAHELTHAVTERSAHLFAYMQSGALNESYSDIFGETVDLLNARGDDAAEKRWLIGEDVPGNVAFRDMRDPTNYGDPGRVGDAQFNCDDPGLDAGGIHTNMGVPNHAFALMVDGGTYNGMTLTGIGLDKAGRIQYRALTYYLVSGADFLDNDTALRQACIDLIGAHDIVASDCDAVGAALDAVELAGPNPCRRGNADPPLCPAGQTAQTLYFDDLEDSGGKWISRTSSVDSWQIQSDFATSGVSHLFAPDSTMAGNARVEMTAGLALPNASRLQFNHAYGFESEAERYYDGGVLEYTTNDGRSWNDAGDLITAGATYGGELQEGFDNPLGGRNAFVGDSFGYTASQLDLSDLAGEQVRFRFRLASDENIGDQGWYVDDFHVYQCIALPSPTATAAPSPSPTATSGTSACLGDCNADGTVSVDEVLKGVNIALAVLVDGDCPAFAGNGRVTVDVLIRAVDMALRGCPVP